jgi:hypothetical protein
MDPTLEKILDFLERAKTRATYGAVAGCIKVPPQSMGSFLTHRCPRESWVVRGDSGNPEGYDPNEKHPELCVNKRIIFSADDLQLAMRLEKRAKQ